MLKHLFWITLLQSGMQKNSQCFTVKIDALFLIILELSVGMTTEGIEVRSVGNTKVSCSFGWLRNEKIDINFI